MKRLPFWLLLAGISCHPVQAAGPYPEVDAAIDARLRQLAGQTADAQDRAWVHRLQEHVEKEQLPHPERPSLKLPRYRIRARALSLLQAWALEEAMQSWRNEPSKRHGPVDDPVQRRARALWIEQASPAELAAFRARQPAGELDEASLLSLLRRDPQPGDWQALMRVGGSRQAIEALSGAQDLLAAQEFSRLLDLAEANRRLSGMALRLRGQWARSRPEQARQLQDRLSHQPLSVDLIEAGIAAGLPDLVDRLARRMAEADDAPLAAWGLWRLDQHALLSRLAAGPATPAHLREEIGRWLD